MHKKYQDHPPPQARQPQRQKDWKTQEQNNTMQNIKQTASQKKPQNNKEQDQHRTHRPRTASRTNHWGPKLPHGQQNPSWALMQLLIQKNTKTRHAQRLPT